MAKEKKLSVERSMKDFQDAYAAKSQLVKREYEDFLFCMGKQWNTEDLESLKQAKIKPVTDNRIQPNLFLLTGLERQNRGEFKAFPVGEEDTLKSEIATLLFKDAIKKSEFGAESSDQFKDGATCGESHLELYLDNTENMLNGKPCWKKLSGGMVFPDPASRKYDFSDARHLYKLTLGLDKDALISMFPEKESEIDKIGGARVSLTDMENDSVTVQHRDYPIGDDSYNDDDNDNKPGCFDLIERYYKKWVPHCYVGDRQTGEIREVNSKEDGEAFIAEFVGKVQGDQAIYAERAAQAMAIGVEGPPRPPQMDLERFRMIERKVPEIWYFAHLPNQQKPLADERAWFYPKWSKYPIVPFFARFSTAPLRGQDKHLLIQGIVHGVKDSQERHNKASTLMLRHLNSSQNSGWEIEEDQLVDRDALRNLGAVPGMVIERKKGTPPLTRIFPMAISQGHAALSQESAEDIKAQLGINADLLAAAEGGADSGRAIALRQKQGLLMVQELFDNLSRTRKIAGQFLLAVMGEIYDTETAKKVLGDAFLMKAFPPMMLLNEQTGQPEPMRGDDGQPMRYDKDMAEVAIAEVLSGSLEKYDVSVGESVSSETIRLAQMAELKDFATAYPGLIPPDVLIDQSQLPTETKERIKQSIQAQQAQAMAAQSAGGAPGAK